MTVSSSHYAMNRTERAIYALARGGLGLGGLKKRFRSFWLKRTPQRPVDANYCGLHLRLCPHENHIDYKILTTAWVMQERNELKFLFHHIPKQGVFLDIGANMGYYSLMMAHHSHAGKIFSIEANPYMFKRLTHHIAANQQEDKIMPINLAVSDYAGEAMFHVANGDHGCSSILPIDDRQDAFKVPVLPLKTILEEQGCHRVDALKIDIEGLEDKALFPYFQAISPQDYPTSIIIEDNSQYWQDNILTWMLAHGYYIHKQVRANILLRLKEAS